MNENNLTLFWDAQFEIVLALEKQHPGVDLEDLSLTKLFECIIQLPNFQDDPALATDEILMAIYQEWYEERNPL